MAWVKVYQLNSKDNGGACLNTDEEYGHVSVWGCAYKFPVYLCRKGIMFRIISFDNEAYAAEWLENHSKEFEEFTLLTKKEDS